MERMLNLDLSIASGATDEGIIGLAQVIDSGGLPKLKFLYLEHLENVTALGFSAMMHAFVKGCPKAELIFMECPDQAQVATFEIMVNCMLKRRVLWANRRNVRCMGITTK